MARMQTTGRYFVLYGRDPVRYKVLVRSNLTISVPWATVGTENVVEDTEWRPFEHHRFGQGFVVHLGPFCFGAGAFERPLSDELWAEVEDKAVWFDMDPEEIGRWRGGLEADATTLGFDFTHREVAGEDRGEGPGASEPDEHGGAEALG